MAWREKMGSDSLTKNPKNPKNLSCEGVSRVNRVHSKGSENEKTIIDVVGGGGFESIEGIEYKIKNEKVYPIPTIEVDAGPVAVKMKSIILGPDVTVDLWPDRATVAGVVYSNDELRDLLSRKISHDALRAVHRMKREFEGQVVPLDEAEKLEPIARW